jgi:DHA2 family multidrug resistance protein
VSPEAQTPLTTARRGLLVASTMLATIIYTLDTTIANVALPHMQGSLQASQDQIAWVLTSYIVVSAIATPLAGFLAVRYGRRNMLIGCVAGFTIASMACGIATSLTEMVLFRMAQGAFGAGLIPLSQAALLDAYPRERHGRATAMWGMGVMVGPILGPTLGGYLTDMYDWRWVFFINVPVGALALAGILASVSGEDRDRARPFDAFGFVLLALGIGLLQLCLDRGLGEDWFESGEILGELFFGLLLLYMFAVHTVTSARPFIERQLFTDRNFLVGLLLIFVMGSMLYATMVLLPPFLEQLQGYPVMIAGFLLAPRGVGTMISMFFVGRLIGRVDARILAAIGMSLMAASSWEMSRFSLDVSAQAVALSGFIQGLGLGMTFVPLTTIAFSTLEPRLRNEASVLFSLVRNIGSSVGISLVVTLLARSTQQNQSHIVESLGEFADWRWHLAHRAFGADAPLLVMREVGRQANAIGYFNDFAMVMVLALGALPLLLLLRNPDRGATAPAATKPS